MRVANTFETLSEDQTTFIIEKWSKHYSDDDIKFNMNMAIAKEYATSITDFNEDFKIDETLL